MAPLSSSRDRELNRVDVSGPEFEKLAFGVLTDVVMEITSKAISKETLLLIRFSVLLHPPTLPPLTTRPRCPPQPPYPALLPCSPPPQLLLSPPETQFSNYGRMHWICWKLVLFSI
eukprot:TRINITY_DN1235_c0_g1_i17.p1 TRINITY_DN1235_c0_g1~~TRINITY_DN1235_c0_g1_i17.p1  ORF type:complete len:116 (-),score=10.75 TRINITY_DN1235_c0_g1_i17:202-549(-)